MKYPTTKTVPQVDSYHGIQVPDPYRWLEDDNATDTKEWVQAQNKVTTAHLEAIPYRQEIAERYEQLFNYPKLSSPFKAGDYYFFYKNDGLQNQPVIYYQKGLDGEVMEFINPNTLSADGLIAIGLAGFSKDNRYVALTKSVGGSDWQELQVMEIATKKTLPDVLKWVKFSGASWYQDGFFYSRYPAPAEGEALKGNNQFHSIYYHQLGTEQSEDRLVFEDREQANMYHFGGTTEDKKYHIVYAAPGTDGYATYYQALGGDSEKYVQLFEGYVHKSDVIFHKDGFFYVKTNIDAPNYRLVKIPINNPAPENWVEIIPEGDHLLASVQTGGGYLFANYLEKASSRIYRLHYDGSALTEIKLPGVGSAGGFSGKEEDDTLFYGFTSFVYPNTIFKYDIKTGISTLFHESELQFNPADYEEKQVFYTSKDGTEVSMFIVHKKGLVQNGNHPCYLYGYGGFNVSLSPFFSASRLILLENGGVFALPNLRGGGEYGEAWHEGGMLFNKQNVFDDFIAAANFLIEEQYTSSNKLAISGGSNGGLLVGACMTQRPDLFAVAFPAVGVLDMLRYHKFTVGKGWIPEYGNAEASLVHFKNLYGYSPLHQLKEGTAYPATMIMTGDHDDRVVPAHSFKFAAQLQKYHSGEQPVLIRVAIDAGHGAGKPTVKIIEEEADRWAFFFHHTNSWRDTKETNPWTTLSKTEAYKNPWIAVSHREVLNPAGGKGIYGVVQFNNVAVGILPLDENNNTWLVGQYRYTLEQYSWEIPEGGSPINTPPLESAKRELKEEVGLVAKTWSTLLEIHTSNSVTDEYGIVYIAKDLTEEAAEPEETEELVIKKLPFEEALQMAMDGRITDSITIAALFKAKLLMAAGEL